MFVLLSVLAGCENYAPSATILSPEDNAQVGAGEPVLFQARVADPESPVGYLRTSWSSDLDGTLEGTKGFEGDVLSLLVEELSAGAHTVSLHVEDPDGASIKRQVSFTVAANTAPTLSFSSPSDGELRAAYAIPVSVTVTDPDEASLRQVELTWSGSAVQAVASLPERPTEAGGVSGSLGEIGPGDWDLTLTATDSLGGQTVTTIAFELVEPDADGDGRETEVLGGEDCDDTDASVYPNAPETCDGADQDCDDVVDEDATDADIWYFDADSDGYGYDWDYITACDDPGSDYCAYPGDCYDYDAEQAPGLDEVCDGKDNDCDDATDEGGVCE